MSDSVLTGEVEGATASTEAAAETPSSEGAVEVPSFLKDLDLDTEIKESKMMQDHKSISDVVKSYYHAKKMVGSDKIAVPGENATDEDMMAVYKKLGLPEEVAKYELHRGNESKVDEKFFTTFKDKAHAAGILPSQAAKLMSFFEEQATTASDGANSEAELLQKKELEELQVEWGAAYKGNVNRANFALKKYGSDTFTEFLGDKGLDSNPQVIKFLAKIGEALGEDNILGESLAANTPSQALNKISSIKSDPNHPYWKGDKVAMAEMEELSKEAYGEE